MIDASGQTDYDYDNLGRLMLKATSRGRINYTYNDTSGRRGVTVTTANQDGSSRAGLGGTSISYTWNSLNQLVSVADRTATTTYGYDAVGNLENINYPVPPAGSQTHYIYDTRNRLKEMTVGSASLARYLYDVAANGRRIRATESGAAVNTPVTRTVDYTYDNLDRLTRELIAGDEGARNGELAYRYDEVGNRVWSKADPFANPGTSAAFDVNDRLGPAANYDKNGNTLVSGSSSYQYDFQNRLQRRTGGAELVYDGDGNLASRTLGGVTTCYLVDDQNPTGHAQVLEELAADRSQVRKRYTWGLQLISQIDDTLPAGDQVSYSGLDGHGNVRFLLKADGTARADRYVYDAFGRMIRTAGTTPNVYLYCGERWDADLGLYYLRARYLNPTTGRFMTMDSFEGAQTDPLSLHKYLFCQSNPVNGVDPSGHSGFNLASLTTSIGTIATLLGQQVSAIVQRAGPAFAAGGRQAGLILQEFGALAQNTAYQVIRIVETSAANLRIVENIQRGTRFIDFSLQYGQRLMDLEVKYKLPSRTGEALTRLVSQAQSSVAVGKAQTVIWTLKEPTLQEVQLVTRQLGEAASKVQFVHGVDGLLQYIALYFGL